MLKIVVRPGEVFNSVTNEFITIKNPTTLLLEHSLVSISKWESKWHKPFLSNDKKTNEELLDYIKCMTITQNVDDAVYSLLSASDFKKINSYIEDPSTATTFQSYNQDGNSYKKKEVLTSEVIYYWMIASTIPFECEKWHLNRLLTLIRVCGIKNNANNSKMSKTDTMRNNHALNKARQAKYHTRG